MICRGVFNLAEGRRSSRSRCSAVLRLLAPAAVLAFPAGAQTAGATVGPTYWAYVANESSDVVSLVRFDGHKAVEEKTIDVGPHPTDLDGAHGLAVSPSGEHWYVSLAHGTPYGRIWKFETGTDRLMDSTTVGLFPATMGLTPDASTLFVVNFNLHGDHIPSSVSAVFTPFMREMKKIETCVMPHGSRLSADGASHYSTCMMSDQLVEIATDRLAVSRRFQLTRGHEQLLDNTASGTHAMGAGVCKPTWVVPSVDDRHLYIPCNGRGEVLEIERQSMEVTRTFATGAGPYNADVSADGQHLVVSLKGNQAIAVIDLKSGTVTQVATTQPVTHGVAVTPDSRYAFVTNEAVGAVRGTVDIFDIGSKELVASVEVQYQPGGIAFWKMEKPDPSR